MCVGNTVEVEVALVRWGAFTVLRVQMAMDGRAQGAKEGASLTVLGKERRLMVWIGAVMGWMETRGEGSLWASRQCRLRRTEPRKVGAMSRGQALDDDKRIFGPCEEKKMCTLC